MGRKPTRPAPVSFSNLRASVQRGPRDSATGVEWYWRVRRHGSDRKFVWSGWASRRSLDSRLVELSGTVPAVANACETVKDVLELYLGYLRTSRDDVNEPTLRKYKHEAKALVTHLGPVKVGALSKRDLLAYPSLRKQSSRTHQAEIDLLRRAWTWASDTELISHPLKFPRLPAAAKRPKYVPEEAEIEAVLQQLGGWMHFQVLMVWATGCRQAAIIGLTWENVHLDAPDPYLRVLGKRTKKDKHPWRNVVLTSPQAIAALRTRRGEKPNPTGRVIDEVTLGTLKSATSRAMTKACSSAGCPRWTLHGLRRAGINKALRAGIDPAAVAAHFGHSALVMYRHYRTVPEGEQREAGRRARLGPQGRGTVIPVQFTQ